MNLPLPPKQTLRCDEQTAQLVHGLLTSVIAGHPQALTTYRFYEEIDQWLGPWGQRGYPIAYGKFYNIAFLTNDNLRADPAAGRWVWNTCVRLQEVLRDYLVGRIRDCTLPRLTESELRQAAFRSHSAIYVRSGLELVALVAPDLLPTIVSIPGAEFRPLSGNFVATMIQALETLFRLLPHITGNALGAAAGPAHNGNLARAVDKDRQQFFATIALGEQLGRVKAGLARGQFDYIPALDLLISRLNATAFPDQRFGAVAREVVELAQLRRWTLQGGYRRLLQYSFEVRSRIGSLYPWVLR